MPEPSAAGDATNTNHCAWCAEPIRAEALVCPHCHRDQPAQIAHLRFHRRANIAIVGGIAALAVVGFFIWGAISYGHKQAVCERAHLRVGVSQDACMEMMRHDAARTMIEAAAAPG